MQDGMLQVNAIVANDGRLVVHIEFPDGHLQMLDRDEAVGFSLTVLQAAASLFPSVSEFSNTIAAARGAIQTLHPAPPQ